MLTYVRFSGGWAVFPHAKFSEAALFRYASFSVPMEFRSTTFSGFTNFANSKFGEKGELVEVVFTDCQFLKPTNFRSARFLSVSTDFAGAVLHDKTSLPIEAVNWPEKVRAEDDWLDSGRLEAERLQDALKKAKASCAVVRQVMGKQGLSEEEHFFFRKEMGFAAQIGGFWERLPYRAFGWVSDFG